MMKPRMNYHCSHRRAGMYLLMETEKIRMAREQEGRGRGFIVAGKLVCWEVAMGLRKVK